MFDFTKEDILKVLNSYPKEAAVKISAEKIEEMRSNQLLKEGFDNLEKCREFYREKPIYSIPFSLFKRYEEDGNRSEFEACYFIHRGHLETWGLSAIFYGDKEDISRLEDTIWAICDEYTWCLPAHMSKKNGIYVNYQPDNFTIDLFAAETGQALAEIIQILGDKLNPLVVQRAKREIKNRIIDRYLRATSNDFWWMKCQNNWAAVCAGSVGMAAICELDDNELLAELLEKVLFSMRTFLSGFSEDGACLEGMSYWAYGFGYFSSFADTLYKRTGGEINLFDNEKVHLIALFPSKNFFYGSRIVSFSDSGSWGSIDLGLATMLKKHYPDMVVPKSARLSNPVSIYGCHRFALSLRGFLWVSDKRPESDCELHIYPLPDAQWYIANGNNNFGLAAKAGNNDEPHNHNDVGHFIVYKNGIEFFCDLGAGEYNKQYFGPERYTFPHCSSLGHSVPIIDGISQSAGKTFLAKDVSVTEQGIKADIAGVYECKDLISLVRDLKFDPENAVVSLRDSFCFEKSPETLIERFVTRIRPEISEGKITLIQSDVSVSLSFDKEQFTAEILPQEHKYHNGSVAVFYYIDLKVKVPKDTMTFDFEIK